MKPSIKIAQRACEAAGARQAIVVLFDATGRFAVTSYGETNAECRAIRPACDAIADALTRGSIPGPVHAWRGERAQGARPRGLEPARAEEPKP